MRLCVSLALLFMMIQPSPHPIAADPAPVTAAVPALAPIAAAPASELRDVVQRYTDDAAALDRRYDAPYSAERRARLREFTTAWRARLKDLDFEALGLEGRIDDLLLDDHLRHQLVLLDREEKRFREMAPLLPFAGAILELQEER